MNTLAAIVVIISVYLFGALQAYILLWAIVALFFVIVLVLVPVLDGLGLVLTWLDERCIGYGEKHIPERENIRMYKHRGGD